MKEYNGHRSWNAWNVSLWMGNDESLYRLASACWHDSRQRPGRAASLFISRVGDTRTPDGGVYNHLCVKIAIQDMGFSNV